MQEFVAKETCMKDEDSYIEISLDSRTIDLSNLRQLVAVKGDSNANLLTFKCPRYYDGTDLSKLAIVIPYCTPSGESDIDMAVDVTCNEELLYFGWLIHDRIASEPGVIKFKILFYDTDDNGNKAYSLNLKAAAFDVDTTLDSEIYTNESDPTYYTLILNILSEAKKVRYEIQGLSETVALNAKSTAENAQSVEAAKDIVLQKHKEISQDADQVAEDRQQVESNTAVVTQTMQDILTMLGNDIATLTNGKIPVSQIPPIALTKTVTVASIEEMQVLTEVEDGDFCRILIDGLIQDTYCRTDGQWLKIGQGKCAEADHALQADTAVNAGMVNNHRIVTMTREEYETAVKDENTLYLVGDFS